MKRTKLTSTLAFALAAACARTAAADDAIRPELRVAGAVGTFGRGRIETNRSRGIGVPVSAVLYGPDGASMQVVDGNRIATKRVQTGITASGRVEVTKGIDVGAVVVAKSGTFLRDGDIIRPVAEQALGRNGG